MPAQTLCYKAGLSRLNLSYGQDSHVRLEPNHLSMSNTEMLYFDRPVRFLECAVRHVHVFEVGRVGD
jgi:hypothetical protein